MDTMTTTFDDKVAILARISKTVDDMPTLQKVAKQIELGLNLASLIKLGVVTELNDKISLVIDSAFRFVLTKYGLEDNGYKNAWDIDPNIPMPKLWIAEGLDDEDD